MWRLRWRPFRWCLSPILSRCGKPKSDTDSIMLHHLLLRLAPFAIHPCLRSILVYSPLALRFEFPLWQRIVHHLRLSLREILEGLTWNILLYISNQQHIMMLVRWWDNANARNMLARCSDGNLACDKISMDPMEVEFRVLWRQLFPPEVERCISTLEKGSLTNTAPQGWKVTTTK